MGRVDWFSILCILYWFLFVCLFLALALSVYFLLTRSFLKYFWISLGNTSYWYYCRIFFTLKMKVTLNLLKLLTILLFNDKYLYRSWNLKDNNLQMYQFFQIFKYAFWNLWYTVTMQLSKNNFSHTVNLCDKYWLYDKWTENEKYNLLNIIPL